MKKVSLAFILVSLLTHACVQQTKIDEMTFDENGYINPVKISFEGVQGQLLEE